MLTLWHFLIYDKSWLENAFQWYQTHNNVSTIYCKFQSPVLCFGLFLVTEKIIWCQASSVCWQKQGGGGAFVSQLLVNMFSLWHSGHCWKEVMFYEKVVIRYFCINPETSCVQATIFWSTIGIVSFCLFVFIFKRTLYVLNLFSCIFRNALGQRASQCCEDNIIKKTFSLANWELCLPPPSPSDISRCLVNGTEKILPTHSWAAEWV